MRQIHVQFRCTNCDYELRAILEHIRDDSARDYILFPIVDWIEATHIARFGHPFSEDYTSLNLQEYTE